MEKSTFQQNLYTDNLDQYVINVTALLNDGLISTRLASRLLEFLILRETKKQINEYIHLALREDKRIEKRATFNWKRRRVNFS